MIFQLIDVTVFNNISRVYYLTIFLIQSVVVLCMDYHHFYQVGSINIYLSRYFACIGGCNTKLFSELSTDSGFL